MRKVIHVWSQRQRWGADQRRHELALSSWQREYKTGCWVSVPVTQAQLRRNAKTTLRDPRELPFLRDLLDLATKQAATDDLICFCNDDTVWAHGITDTVLHVKHCAFASRHEFVRLPKMPTCIEIIIARKHCGCDFFVFRPRWWQANRRDMPDMILGCEAWDLVLRKLMASCNGAELHAAIAHEEHGATWQGRRNDPSALHNRKLAGEWLAKRGLTWD